MGNNPYKVDGEIIPQFKQEARTWDEGYAVCKKDMIDKLTEMDNALKDARKALKNIHDWKVRIINGEDNE